MIDKGVLDKDYHTAIHDYNEAILHGIVKIAAKMGISTLQSYQSAQIFEAWESAGRSLTAISPTL